VFPFEKLGHGVVGQAEMHPVLAVRFLDVGQFGQTKARRIAVQVASKSGMVKPMAGPVSKKAWKV
jgi:hypothetical protein